MTGLKAFIGIKYHQGLNILYPADTIYLFNILIASSNILWPINFKYVDMILLVITGSCMHWMVLKFKILTWIQA